MAGHKKTILSNFISLSVAQGLNILFPLITFPYLLRILGIEGFGLFTLIQTSIMYFDLLVSFGFSLTATQHIAGSLTDKVKTSQVIVSVYFIKSLLFVLSLIIFLVLTLFIPYLRDNISLVLMSSLYLLGNLLFPDWYFQGIQKMRYITLVAFVSKAISLLMIIFLVKQHTDIFYAIFALSMGNLVAGIIAFFLLLKTVSVKWELPDKAFVVLFFKESMYVFTSIILAPLYSSINIFILQAFTNSLMVGYYAVADKIFGALGMLTSIANRTLFPHLSILYKTSVVAYKKNIKTIVTLFAAAFLVLAIVQFFAADEIVRLITGKKYKYDVLYSVQILKIMSIGLIFSPFVSFFFQLLILQGQKKIAIKNVMIVVLINLVTGCTFAYFFSGKGMAVNLCITVFLIAALNFSAFYKRLKATEHALD